MTLRKTIFIASKESSDIITVKIFTADHVHLSKRGIWNIDNNTIMLSPDMYNQFAVLKNQDEQRKFFMDLKKVSVKTSE
jgi:hypothetical protein